jgi:hypothetical protein
LRLKTVSILRPTHNISEPTFYNLTVQVQILKEVNQIPWENASIESFYDKLRDEDLNREAFGSLLEAQIAIEQWRIFYNMQRPHSSLEYKTPAEYSRRRNSSGLRSGYALSAARTEKKKQTKTMAELYL